jgi:hypothetical protein
VVADHPRTDYAARVRRGRILSIKWGMNPNSSSLGVDVTFLLVGATALAIVTPVIGALLRWRRPLAVDDKAAPPSGGAAGAGNAGPSDKADDKPANHAAPRS